MMHVSPHKDSLPERQISKEDFDTLLSWLGKDREQAGEKYEHIRKCLIEYFRRRGALDPLSLADEVIDRVTQKAHSVGADYAGDPIAYFLGVARKVLAEVWRQPMTLELPDDLSVTFAPDDEYREQLLQKLERCWTKLPQPDREVLLRYYGGNSEAKLREEREQLACDRGMTPNALRVTMHRLREKLKRCIEKEIRKTG